MRWERGEGQVYLRPAWFSGERGGRLLPQELALSTITEASQLSDQLDTYFNRELATRRGNNQVPECGQCLGQLGELADTLDSPEFMTWVKQGFLTCAMFKPNLYDKFKAGRTDNEVAGILYQVISLREFIPVVELSLWVDEKFLDVFYANAREKMGEQQWQQFTEKMQQGPVTFMILYDPYGQADKHWREVIGPLQPEVAAEGTIRGDFALNLTRGNLVHGSSYEDRGAVSQEIKVFVDFLRNLNEKLPMSR